MHHAHKSFKSGMQEWFTIDKNINEIHHLNILIKKKKQGYLNKNKEKSTKFTVPLW